MLFKSQTHIPIQAGSSKTPHIVSATKAACNSYSNATYLYHSTRHEEWKEGNIASFFVQDLGLALAAPMCSPTTGLQTVHNGQALL